MPRQLFRQEAIDAQREKYLGETTLARPVAYWVYTLLAAAIAVLLIWAWPSGASTPAANASRATSPSTWAPRAS